MTLPDQDAVDALAEQFRNACDAVEPVGSQRLRYTSSAIGEDVAAGFTCSPPDIDTDCTDNDGVLDFDGDYAFRCSNAALPDEEAVNALAAQFEARCVELDPSLFLEHSSTPDGDGLRATFTCRFSA